MITNRTLRRKLQKKCKHRQYGQCTNCGERGKMRYVKDGYILKQCWHCGLEEKLYWTGVPR